MATTLMPLDPAVSPQRVSRVLTISANLLPAEIVAARRARRSRTWVLITVFLVVLALAGWYVHAATVKRSADDELAAATTAATAVRHSETQYDEVLTVQAQTDAITNRLSALLADDLPWSTLLDTLRDVGDEAGVTVTGVNGSLVSDGGKGVTSTLPSASGATTVGMLTITGIAPDKPSVARYVDTLNAVTMVANPYVTSVTQNEAGVQFSLSVDVTSAALCGRFTTACKKAGED
ncbi:PilN domain-containing protein [Mangrovihabitans endophyticus]|uniref:Fimbrial assembly protein (PilN) n=1 Tax=Mangrovihabitans endophyticus TaxID=1751298 RepID=A0A8J3BZF6_9ACTN|nr:PilN domain-containing protein [Mangrovihabitans endophyticus]GGK86522.1 hypothetical protein GCM10012284_20890 [Mangrovihabitans endophyticus]